MYILFSYYKRTQFNGNNCCSSGRGINLLIVLRKSIIFGKHIFL